MVPMNPETMVVAGLVLTVLGLLTGLAGWMLVKLRLSTARRETFTVVDKTSTDSRFWKTISMEWEASPKNYWVWVRSEAPETESVDDRKTPYRGHRVRVPRWNYFELFPPDSQLQLTRSKDGEPTHPFYLVRSLLWGFGLTAIVLLINGVGLFIMDEAFVPSWMEWTGIN